MLVEKRRANVSNATPIAPGHFQVGDVEIRLVTEMVHHGAAPPGGLLPQFDPSVVAENGSWLSNGYMTQDLELVTMSSHSWVVKVSGQVILIDAGIGSDKERPTWPGFTHLETPYLANLAAAGVSPEDIDFVLHTHLHVDHVGWNTRLQNGSWVPTFPNAKHVFSRREYEFNAAPENAGSNTVAFADSLRPIVDAGKAIMIDADNLPSIEGVTFHSTPGHSIDHLSISVGSHGEEAFFAGDVMHHPIQVYRPEWNSIYCEQPDRARASRRWALEYAVDRRLLYFGGHFAQGSAGRVLHRGAGFAWQKA